MKEAHQLRKEFIKKFGTDSVPQYRSVMGHGDFYGANGHRGRIWEIIRPYKIISMEIALKLISEMDEVFVMWDNALHETSRILQKTRIVKTKGDILAEDLGKPRARRECFDFLPQDIYVFGRNFDYHITVTCEYLRGFGYICLTSLDNLLDDGVTSAFREIFEYYELGKL